MCDKLFIMAILKTLMATAALAIVMTVSPLSSAFAQSKGNCTCRFAGQNYKTGDIMCIRGKLSRCEFVLNNTSWKTVAETCPQASAPDLLQSPINENKTTTLARMQNRFSIK